MLNLSAKIRKISGKKVKNLRKKGKIPAVVYGPEIKSLSIELNLKEFEKIFKEAGESSLISLKIEGGKSQSKKFMVLIHDLAREPITLKPLHVDFYQPKLKEKVEATVPLVFEGESKAVEEMKGTLVKNISEVEVKALPQDLPKEIKVNIDSLKTFDDTILIKDLEVSEKIQVLKDPGEVVALVTSPEKVEEELEKPIAAPVGEPRLVGREEKVEGVEKVEEKEEEEKEEK